MEQHGLMEDSDTFEKWLARVHYCHYRLNYYGTVKI